MGPRARCRLSDLFSYSGPPAFHISFPSSHTQARKPSCSGSGLMELSWLCRLLWGQAGGAGAAQMLILWSQVWPSREALLKPSSCLGATLTMEAKKQPHMKTPDPSPQLAWRTTYWDESVGLSRWVRDRKAHCSRHLVFLVTPFPGPSCTG